MTTPSRFALPCFDPCHQWPYKFYACSGCEHATPMPCSTPCHAWPYDPAYCCTCTESRQRPYSVHDTIGIRTTHPVPQIHGATATVVATTPYSALVQFHNPTHGILYGSLGRLLEIENLHLEHLPVPAHHRPFIKYPLHEEA